MNIVIFTISLGAIGWVVFDALRNWKAAGNDPAKNDALEFLDYFRGSATVAWAQFKILLAGLLGLAAAYIDVIASPEVAAAINGFLPLDKAAMVLAVIGFVTRVVRARTLPAG